ncbi:MAG: hypothetical protein LBU32_22540 [Clostridiales bacterium]|jgi:hypothetical protein|nr:hypothetical protein [Clostridiales bacterium]
MAKAHEDPNFGASSNPRRAKTLLRDKISYECKNDFAARGINAFLGLDI